MGRWKASLIFSGIARISKSINPNKISSIYHPIKPPYISPVSIPRFHFLNFRSFSAVPCPSTIYGDEYDNNFDQNYVVDPKDDEESGTIPIRAFFLCTRYFFLITRLNLYSLMLFRFLACGFLLAGFSLCVFKSLILFCWN